MTLEQQFEKYLRAHPSVDESAFVHPDATLIGAVTLKRQCSVWPRAVLRADIHSIVVEEGTNIQDGAVVHLADDFGVRIGKYVTIGHLAMIHACTIEDECLIGMQATILDGAKVGARSIVGAGAVVTKGMEIPPGSLVLGMPAKVVRPLTAAEIDELKPSATKYIQVAAAHRALLQK